MPRKSNISVFRDPPDDLAERLYRKGANLTPSGTVTVDDVAERAGVPRATAYYYFPGRDSLLNWMTLQDLRRQTQALEAIKGAPGRARLLSMLIAIGEMFAKRPAMAVRLMSVLTADSASADVRRETEARLITPLRLAISEGLTAGKLRLGSRDADVALAMVSGLASVVAMRANRGETKDLRYIIEGLARQLLDGVHAPAVS